MARTRSSSLKTKSVSSKKPTISKKKVAITPESKPKTPVVSDATTTIEPSVLGDTTVTIEHCKSWGAFRSRAAKIQKAVGSKAKVEINKEKPGKGNFIITVSGVDDPIVELKGLTRPFPSLKALDMDEVVDNVMKAIPVAE